MRFVLCVVIAALLPISALAATRGGSMSLSQTQAAAARGDLQAAAALSTMTNRDGCMKRVRFPWSSKRSMRQRQLAPAFATQAASSDGARRSRATLNFNSGPQRGRTSRASGTIPRVQAGSETGQRRREETRLVTIPSTLCFASADREAGGSPSHTCAGVLASVA